MKRELKQVLDDHIAAAEVAGDTVMCICCGERPAQPGFATCRASCTRKYSADFEREHKRLLKDNRMTRAFAHHGRQSMKRTKSREQLNEVIDDILRHEGAST